MRLSKFFFVFFLILLSLSAHLSAQSLRVGLHAGPDLTDLRWQNDIIQADLYDPKVGFVVGGDVVWQFSKHFGVGAGLNLERKGGGGGVLTDENGYEVPGGKFRYHFDYLSVPIFLEASAGNKLRYIVRVGSTSSYLLSQKDVLKGFTVDQMTFDTTINQTGKYERLDVGLSGALGLEVPINEKIHFRALTQGTYGLVNLYKLKGEGFSEVRNTFFAVTFGLTFLL